MNKHLSFIQSLSAPLIEIHYHRPLTEDLPYIRNEHDSIALLRELINPNRIDLKEFFWIILLSNANRVLGMAEISVGKLNCTTIDIRELMQLALLTNASNIILAHNHPSGDLRPSQADIAITKKIISVGKILDIKVLDHFIISSNAYQLISHEVLY